MPAQTAAGRLHGRWRGASPRNSCRRRREDSDSRALNASSLSSLEELLPVSSSRLSQPPLMRLESPPPSPLRRPPSAPPPSPGYENGYCNQQADEADGQTQRCKARCAPCPLTRAHNGPASCLPPKSRVPSRPSKLKLPRKRAKERTCSCLQPKPLRNLVRFLTVGLAEVGKSQIALLRRRVNPSLDVCVMDGLFGMM